MDLRLAAKSRAVPALLAVALLGAFCPKEAPKVPPSAAPAAVKLGALSSTLSEPGGYFDSDNLISNETSYLQVADQLQQLATPGDVYVGVGPDQNFNYIARLKPSWAFIVDIRRQNMLQHLLFAWLLAEADDPYQYLCRLFSRTCPAVTPAEAKAGAKSAIDALRPLAPSEEVFGRNLGSVLSHAEGTLGFTLTPQDRTDLRAIYRAFFEEQTEIRFKSFRRPWALYHPTFRTLLEMRSPSGKIGSFLDSAQDYTVVRDLSRQQRIVPIVGDFAGPQAFRAIGDWLRARQLSVSVFYTSNVEFYLLRNDAFERFAANVKALPTKPDSLLIRACFDYGRSHPAELNGHRSATVLQRIPRFLELFAAGSYTSYWDVCTLDYLK